MAVESAKFDIVKMLIPKADVNQEIRNGRTLLHFAAENGQLEIIETILEKVEDINKKDEYHETPFALSAKHNHLDIVKLLISKVDDVNPEYGGMYLHYYFNKHACPSLQFPPVCPKIF